jgi:hypothetical protein
MITKATIEEKIDKYKFRVRIPIYNKQKDAVFATPTNELDVALVCTLPGCDVNYQVGDVVYVGFDDAQDYEPVILGLLYREKDTGTLMSITAESLKTKVSTDLSPHTSIGDIDEFNIKALYGANNSLQKEIDRLKRKTIPKVMTTNKTHTSGSDDYVTFDSNVDEYTVSNTNRIDVVLSGANGVFYNLVGAYYEKQSSTYNLKVYIPESVVTRVTNNNKYDVTIKIYGE